MSDGMAPDRCSACNSRWCMGACESHAALKTVASRPRRTSRRASRHYVRHVPKARRDIPLVVIESPYSSPTPEGLELNMRYLRACMADCLRRGEAPYASHALYTQPGVLDDTKPVERKLGMEAGFAWGARAEWVVVYVDLGMTDGMREGIKRAKERGQMVEMRYLEGWK